MQAQTRKAKAEVNAYADQLSYAERWDAYCAGMISTTTLTDLMRRDEVFARWCQRKVREIRKRVEQANGKEAEAADEAR